MPQKSSFISGRSVIRILFVCVAIVLLSSPVFSQEPGDIIWLDQFGSALSDGIQGVYSGTEGIYVAGFTNGIGTFGGEDCFVRKYDHDGNVIWSRQFGTSETDYATGISADTTGVYVVGFTSGNLPGEINIGGEDIFVRKYDSEGNVIWTHQFGSSTNDRGNSVRVDDSGEGVYVAGHTYGTLVGQTSSGMQDAFVRKYDVNGNILWTQQFGTIANDGVDRISADETGVYVAGSTGGNFPGQIFAGGITDAFVRKFDVDGNVAWTHQFGTPERDQAYGISVDSTGVYAAGFTNGTLPGQTFAGGSSDAFVQKFDTSGNILWTRQFGTLGDDSASDVSVDSGRVYVTGNTGGVFAGQTNQGGIDAFIRRYDATGNIEWTRQFGTYAREFVIGTSAGYSGIFLGGFTEGAFPEQVNYGGRDAFLVKFSDSLPVVIDIKPGSDVNPINLKSKGLVPVAILSTTQCNTVEIVDIGTLTFGRTGNEQSLAFCDNGTSDVNSDGLYDLVCHFNIQETGFLDGDTEGVLMGLTVGGLSFEGFDVAIILNR